MFITLSNLFLLASTFVCFKYDGTLIVRNNAVRYDDASIGNIRQYELRNPQTADGKFSGLTTDANIPLFYYDDSEKPLVDIEFYDGAEVSIDFYPLQNCSLKDSPYYNLVFSSNNVTYGDITNLYFCFTFYNDDFVYSINYNCRNNLSDLPSEDQEYGATRLSVSLPHSQPSDLSYGINVTMFTTQQDGHAYSDGYQDGYKDGQASVTPIHSGDLNFGNYLFSIFDVPIYIVRKMFDFNVYGINIFGALLSIASIIIIIGIVRRFLH